MPKSLSTLQAFDLSIFEIDQEKGMVNLTKIADHFGKRVSDWKKLSSTQKFLKAFFVKNSEGENLTVINGGKNPDGSFATGTWASRKLALKFAEWISVDFEIYANEVIDQLFSTGSVQLISLTEEQQLTNLFPTSDNHLITLTAEMIRARKESDKLLAHKQSVVLEIADKVPDKTLRAIINQICRWTKTTDYGNRWRTLYKEFKYIYHKDIETLDKHAGQKVLDYVESHDLMQPLYELAIKLFETDNSKNQLLLN